MNKMLVWLMRSTTTLALMLTVLNVNATCGYIFHQPKLPVAALKYKK